MTLQYNHFCLDCLEVLLCRLYLWLFGLFIKLLFILRYFVMRLFCIVVMDENNTYGNFTFNFNDMDDTWDYQLLIQHSKLLDSNASI